MLATITRLVLDGVDGIEDDKSSMTSVSLATNDSSETLNRLAGLLAAREHDSQVRIGDVDAFVEDARSTQHLRKPIGEQLHRTTTLVRLRARRHGFGLNTRAL